jgi:hypothetical protein
MNFCLVKDRTRTFNFLSFFLNSTIGYWAHERAVTGSTSFRLLPLPKGGALFYWALFCTGAASHFQFNNEGKGQRASRSHPWRNAAFQRTIRTVY